MKSGKGTTGGVEAYSTAKASSSTEGLSEVDIVSQRTYEMRFAESDSSDVEEEISQLHVQAEYDSFKKVRPLPTSANPMKEFWIPMRNAYPLLFPVACKYFCCQGTSAPVERLFSRCSLVDTEKRRRLRGETLTGQVIAGDNWKLHENDVKCNAKIKASSPAADIESVKSVASSISHSVVDRESSRNPLLILSTTNKPDRFQRESLTHKRHQSIDTMRQNVPASEAILSNSNVQASIPVSEEEAAVNAGDEDAWDTLFGMDDLMLPQPQRDSVPGALGTISLKDSNKICYMKGCKDTNMKTLKSCETCGRMYCLQHTFSHTLTCTAKQKAKEKKSIKASSSSSSSSSSKQRSDIFTRLTKEENAIVFSIFAKDADDIVISKFNVDFRAEDLQCLKSNSGWVNDEVINFWLSMVEEMDLVTYLYELENNREYKRSLFLNSFFFSKLFDEDKAFTPKKIERYVKMFDVITTKRKRTNVFELKNIYMPVNTTNTHWTLLVFSMEYRTIWYYDHLYEDDERSIICTEMALKWLEFEADRWRLEGIDVGFDRETWTIISSMGQDIPKQGDGSSCGVFVCADLYMLWNKDRIADDSYAMTDICIFRRALCKYIAHGTLVNKLGYSQSVLDQLSAFGNKREPGKQDTDSDSENDVIEVNGEPLRRKTNTTQIAVKKRKSQMESHAEAAAGATEKRTRSIKNELAESSTCIVSKMQSIKNETHEYSVGDRVKAVGRCRDARREQIPYGTSGVVTEIIMTASDNYTLVIKWDNGQPSSNHLPKGFWASDVYDVYK
jgi:Ulp1 protease family, C-terminal catalytic domain/hAT family C-terminal dimerisation region